MTLRPGEPQPGEMTAKEISDATGIPSYSVQKAIDALGVQGTTYLSDRRKVYYPAGTAERVQQWLINNPR